MILPDPVRGIFATMRALLGCRHLGEVRHCSSCHATSAAAMGYFRNFCPGGRIKPLLTAHRIDFVGRHTVGEYRVKIERRPNRLRGRSVIAALAAAQ
jgi:hypothetical protein